MRHLADQLMDHLQPHHLANAFGFFLQLGADQRTLFAATEGAPHLFTQLAADVDWPPPVSQRRVFVTGRCRRGHAAAFIGLVVSIALIALFSALWQHVIARLGQALQRAQLLLDVVVIRRRQAAVGVGTIPQQKVLQRLVADGFTGQVGVLRRLAHDRLIGHIADGAHGAASCATAITLLTGSACSSRTRRAAAGATAPAA